MIDQDIIKLVINIANTFFQYCCGDDLRHLVLAEEPIEVVPVFIKADLNLFLSFSDRFLLNSRIKTYFINSLRNSPR